MHKLGGKVLLFEFLNRISFFSILTWGFFFIAAVCAILLTSLRSPLLRRYRSFLLGTATSAILLGSVSWSLPFFLSRLNPDQSRLTPIDQLITTEWIEPVSNPETDEVLEDEISWAKAIHYQFKYKLKFGYEFQKALISASNALVLLDQKGNLHGFNAYTGLNHWVIRLRINQLLGFVSDQKKLYLLERTSLDALRVSSVDFTNPALLWQRTIPRSKEGSISIDEDTQSVLISSGSNGVWALKTRTGEILWKRPELFSKTLALPNRKQVLIFEPSIAGRSGYWYFLDPLSGKTLHKTPHTYPDLMGFWVQDPTRALPSEGQNLVLAQVDPEHFFLLNPTDLSEPWAFHSDSPVRLAGWFGRDNFFIYTIANLLELRTLQNNQLRWQKSLNPISQAWLKPSPDRKHFAMPSESEGESKSISFFKSDTAEYLGSAHTSESLTDLYYLGDWLYLMSENHLWALKKAVK